MDAYEKHRIMKRLEAEGRWNEAATWKNERIKCHRAAGLLRPEASDAAWRELEREFQPQPAPEPSADERDDFRPSKLATTWEKTPLVENEFPWSIPEDDDPDPDDAERWLARQFGLIWTLVARRDEVVMMLDWTKATGPPPNMLAINYARDAAKEQDGIFGNIKDVILYTTHRWARLDPR
jgi:hypothetical protein